MQLAPQWIWMGDERSHVTIWLDFWIISMSQSNIMTEDMALSEPEPRRLAGGKTTSVLLVESSRISREVR
jgi:hypothetical protein